MPLVQIPKTRGHYDGFYFCSTFRKLYIVSVLNFCSMSFANAAGSSLGGTIIQRQPKFSMRPLLYWNIRVIG